MIFLLTFKRHKNWGAIIVYAILLAALELSNEVTYAVFILGFLVMLAAFIIKNRTLKFPPEIIHLLSAIFFSGILTLFQGGVISGVFEGWLNRAPNIAGEGGSFHNISFFLAFPPGFVNAQLGFLSFFNPIHLLVLLLEIGPDDPSGYSHHQMGISRIEIRKMGGGLFGGNGDCQLCPVIHPDEFQIQQPGGTFTSTEFVFIHHQDIRHPDFILMAHSQAAINQNHCRSTLVHHPFWRPGSLQH